MPQHTNFSETEDVCSNFTGEHYHIFLYLKTFVGAESFIKESITENITRRKPPLKIRNSFVKLFTVSYPENCIKREASYGGNRFFIYGERMKSMFQIKSTKDLGCNFANLKTCGNYSDLVTLSLTRMKTPRNYLICAENWRSCRSPTQFSKILWLISSICFNVVSGTSTLLTIVMFSKWILDIPMPSANVLNAPKLQTLYSRAMRQKISNLILICFLS